MKKIYLIASLAIFGLLAIGTLSVKADTVSDDTATTTPEISTSTPVKIIKNSSHPVVIMGFTTGRIDDFTGSEFSEFPSLYGKIGFLSTMSGIACVGTADNVYCEKSPSVYHLIDINGFKGMINPFIYNFQNSIIRGLSKIIK
jgi:hypothetical protein